MPQRALITGISGFAGGFLAEQLLHCGDLVLGCSPDGSWTAASPESIRPRVELAAWDLSVPGDVPGAVRRRIEQFRPEAIYHLAAVSTPRDCGDEEPTPQAVALNVGGTRRVLELAGALAWRPRVVLVSSSHVYAPVTRESYRVAEDAPLAPRGAYGRTKLAAEEEVRRAVREQGCDAVIARAFRHAGPRQIAPLMLPEWSRQFAQGGPEPVRVQTCDAYVDLSDVRDVVRAYRLLAQRGRRGEVYNVGSGVSRRSGHILELMRGMADPARPVVELQPGFKQDPIADVTRLVRATGWTPEIPLEQTVADTLAWWREKGSGFGVHGSGSGREGSGFGVQGSGGTSR